MLHSHYGSVAPIYGIDNWQSFWVKRIAAYCLTDSSLKRLWHIHCWSSGNKICSDCTLHSCNAKGGASQETALLAVLHCIDIGSIAGHHNWENLRFRCWVR